MIRAFDHPSRQHADGLLRGLCVAAALLVPVIVSCAATTFDRLHADHLDADRARAFAADRP